MVKAKEVNNKLKMYQFPVCMKAQLVLKYSAASFPADNLWPQSCSFTYRYVFLWSQHYWSSVHHAQTPPLEKLSGSAHVHVISVLSIKYLSLL